MLMMLDVGGQRMLGLRMLRSAQPNGARDAGGDCGSGRYWAAVGEFHWQRLSSLIFHGL